MCSRGSPNSCSAITLRLISDVPPAIVRARAIRYWSTLGDLGHVDADGYLYLSARRTDLILSGGVNIYP